MMELIQNLLLPGLVAWIVYKKTKNHQTSVISGAVTWLLQKIILKEGFSKDQEWRKVNNLLDYGKYPGPSKQYQGDLTLTNMYRRLHNMDAIQRTEIFQFNDALAGGSHGISRERWVGEAYDRNMMDLKHRIREDIAKKRIPYDEESVPTKPLMGNFWDCHMGNCQWDADSEGKILGIPSQVGTIHPYY